MNIRIATRKSPLAQWQAHYVGKQFIALHPDNTYQLILCETQADILIDQPLQKLGGKGLFVKALESALLENQADCAVHSMKDMPSQLEQPFHLAAICKRDVVCDILLSNHALQDLSQPLVIGTSSPRRITQLKQHYPHWTTKPIRGNIQTRIKHMQANNYDGIILAATGLKRLNIQHKNQVQLPILSHLPAPGQAAIGVECLTENKKIRDCLAKINHAQTAQCVNIERQIMHSLGGHCYAPIAIYCHYTTTQHMTIHGYIGAIKANKTPISHAVTGSITQHHDLIAELLSHINTAEAQQLIKDYHALNK